MKSCRKYWKTYRMKWIHVVAIISLSFGVQAQRDLTPNSKKSAFGKRDLRALSNYGLQFQLGGTYLMSKLKNDVIDVTPTTGGFRGNFLHDPKGKLGAYAEIGMFHFPKKRSKLSLWLKTVLVSYYDWGIGFKYFRGMEITETNFIDIGGTVTDTYRDPFNFELGYVYGRFSLHKNINFKKNRGRDKSDFFLDNSLGINVDYRVLTKSEAYGTGYAVTSENQRYSNPLNVQLHYGLSFGFRLKRGAYLIPGVRVPLLGYQSTSPIISKSLSGETAFGDPQFRWYSSKYWPLLFHVKYMFAFEKKNKKGCPPAEVNDQDKNTQNNR